MHNACSKYAEPICILNDSGIANYFGWGCSGSSNKFVRFADKAGIALIANNGWFWPVANDLPGRINTSSADSAFAKRLRLDHAARLLGSHLPKIWNAACNRCF